MHQAPPEERPVLQGLPRDLRARAARQGGTLSIEALKWAFEQEHVPSGPRFVLVALANRANDEGGDLYPSLRWIKKKTGIPDRTIRHYVTELMKLGLLIKTERTRDDGGRTSNEYRLPLTQPGLRFDTPPATAARGTDAIAGAPVPAATHPRQPLPGAPATTAALKTKVLKKESNYLSPLAADLFDQAWKGYPKRAGNNPKGRAVRQWNARLRGRASAMDMLAAVRRYAAFCAATGKLGLETVMMASTFFGADKPYEQSWEIPRPPDASKSWPKCRYCPRESSVVSDGIPHCSAQECTDLAVDRAPAPVPA